MTLLRQGQSGLGAFIQSPLGVRGLGGGGFCPSVAMHATTTAGTSLLLISKATAQARVLAAPAASLPTWDSGGHVYYTQRITGGGLGKATCDAAFIWETDFEFEGEGGVGGTSGNVGPGRVFATMRYRSVALEPQQYRVVAYDKADGAVVWSTEYFNPDDVTDAFSAIHVIAADDLGGCYWRERSSGHDYLFYASPAGSVNAIATFSFSALGFVFTRMDAPQYADGFIYTDATVQGGHIVAKFNTLGVPVAYSTEIESLLASPTYTSIQKVGKVADARALPIIVALLRADGDIDLFSMDDNMTVDLINTVSPIANKLWSYDGTHIYTQAFGSLGVTTPSFINRIDPATGVDTVFFDPGSVISGTIIAHHMTAEPNA